MKMITYIFISYMTTFIDFFLLYIINVIKFEYLFIYETVLLENGWLIINCQYFMMFTNVGGLSACSVCVYVRTCVCVFILAAPNFDCIDRSHSS